MVILFPTVYDQTSHDTNNPLLQLRFNTFVNFLEHDAVNNFLMSVSRNRLKRTKFLYLHIHLEKFEKIILAIAKMNFVFKQI